MPGVETPGCRKGALDVLLTVGDEGLLQQQLDALTDGFGHRNVTLSGCPTNQRGLPLRQLDLRSDHECHHVIVIAVM